MSEFVLKEIEAIKGSKYDFYKLEIDGDCAFDEFEKEISSNKKYFSEFKSLLSYAQHYANGSSLPDRKLKPIHLKIQDVTTLELRSKNLRIYFFYSRSQPDRIIALCGYKKKQKSDIIKLTSKIKRYLID